MLTNQLQMCMPLDFLTYKILHTDPPFGPSNKPNPSPPPPFTAGLSFLPLPNTPAPPWALAQHRWTYRAEI